MAIMIPTVPRDYAEASLEGVMYDALSKLPDDYYVIHSFKQVSVKDDVIFENEADFLIFNTKKGVIVIEAKAGMVQYADGE